MTELVLASRSAARAAMLEAAGLKPRLVPAEVDERALDRAWASQGRSPAEIAGLLAEAKALAVSHAHPDAMVIGADQTLALGERRFSKAADLAEARANLAQLRGRTHQLHSGVALVRGGRAAFRDVTTADMTMRDFSDAFLEDYLRRTGGHILASVGCYRFESEGIQLFERIEGDYFTILGMPLLPLLAALRREGLIPS